MALTQFYREHPAASAAVRRLPCRAARDAGRPAALLDKDMLNATPCFNAKPWPATLRAARLAAPLAMLLGATAAHAQTTPCDAIFEPVLAAGIAEADLHLRRQWRMIEGTWVTAYTLEGEKANPFDASKLRGPPAALSQGKATPAQVKAAPSAGPASPRAAPLPPITGFATARDVRCNANAASARPDVVLVYWAAGVRFQEGRGPWSAPLPGAVIAVIQLRRAGDGWTIVDRTAEGGVMPPDARRSPPHDTLARDLATSPWQPSRKPRKVRRG